LPQELISVAFYLGVPQATQGSGYLLQSFCAFAALRLKTKRISAAILHAKHKLVIGNLPLKTSGEPQALVI
jgi:hypothetical protein